MPFLITPALVLHRSDYSDSDRMVTLLTPSAGLVDAVARGCRRSRSPLMNATEPFTYGEYTLFRNRDRYEIRTCSILDSHYDLRGDIDKLSAASYWMRLLSLACTHGTDASAIMDMSLRALAYLTYGENEPALMTFAFESKLLFLSGLSPRTDRCGACGERAADPVLFDPLSGGVVCRSCSSSGRPISAMARRILNKLPRSAFENLALLRDVPEWKEAAAHLRAFLLAEIPVPPNFPPGIPA